MPATTKYDPAETGLDTAEKTFDPSSFMDAYTKMASILRENNIPFEVLATKNIRDYKGKAILICNVPHIRDEEMDALEAYVQGGGSLYISGPIGHAKLEKLLGAKVTGMTQHNFTYMDPTAAGSDIFAGFSKLAPLTVARAQYQAEIINPRGAYGAGYPYFALYADRYRPVCGDSLQSPGHPHHRALRA